MHPTASQKLRLPPAPSRQYPPRCAPRRRRALRTGCTAYRRRGRAGPRSTWRNRAVSLWLAVSQSVGGWALKNSVSMLPTRVIACGDSRLLAAAAQAALQPGRQRFQLLVRRMVAQLLQRGDARRRRHRIAAQRAGLKHLARRQNVLHDLAPAAVGADRHAAADDLAERRDVRPNSKQRLRTAIRHAKAGHHFVADQAALRACCVSSRSARRNSGVGTTQPMLPTIGSKITPAIRGPCSANVRSRPATSL